MREAMRAQETATRDGSAGLDRRALIFGVAALAVALFSYGFAWRGGLWTTPLWVVLGVASWRRARRSGQASRDVVALVAALAVFVGAFAFVSAGDIRPALRTDSRSYAAGDTVVVHLKAGIRGVETGLCPFDFHRLTERGWQRVEIDPPPRGVEQVCPLVLYGWGPLLGTEVEIDLRPDVPAGVYRISHEVGVREKKRELRTPPFAVTG